MFAKLYKYKLISNVFILHNQKIGSNSLWAYQPEVFNLEMSNNYTVFRTANFTYLSLHINNWAFRNWWQVWFGLGIEFSYPGLHLTSLLCTHPSNQQGLASPHWATENTWVNVTNTFLVLESEIKLTNACLSWFVGAFDTWNTLSFLKLFSLGPW